LPFADRRTGRVHPTGPTDSRQEARAAWTDFGPTGRSGDLRKIFAPILSRAAPTFVDTHRTPSTGTSLLCTNAVNDAACWGQRTDVVYVGVIVLFRSLFCGPQAKSRDNAPHQRRLRRRAAVFGLVLNIRAPHFMPVAATFLPRSSL